MKRKERKNIAAGQAHIQSTFNNTVVTITDLQGNAAVSYTHLDVYKRQPQHVPVWMFSAPPSTFTLRSSMMSRA